MTKGKRVGGARRRRWRESASARAGFPSFRGAACVSFAFDSSNGNRPVPFDAFHRRLVPSHVTPDDRRRGDGWPVACMGCRCGVPGRPRGPAVAAGQSAGHARRSDRSTARAERGDGSPDPSCASRFLTVSLCARAAHLVRCAAPLFLLPSPLSCASFAGRLFLAAVLTSLRSTLSRSRQARRCSGEGPAGSGVDETGEGTGVDVEERRPSAPSSAEKRAPKAAGRSGVAAGR